jgi:hypothetical protein
MYNLNKITLKYVALAKYASKIILKDYVDFILKPGISKIFKFCES